MKNCFLSILIVCLISNTQFSQNQIWKDLSTVKENKFERVIIPDNYRLIEIDIPELRNKLRYTPLENSFGSQIEKNEILLPMPDGSNQLFYYWESSVMASELQSNYPEIRTYTGQGIDDKAAILKMDLTPHGFHAMILSPGGRVFIDPYAQSDIFNYISYYANDFSKKDLSKDCELFIEDGKYDELRELKDNFVFTPTGSQLRTYRLCVAATGEYTNYHGGTVPLALSAIATSVNRVNGVYEKEAAIRMILIANNNLVIYTNPSTDPYSNSNGSAMLTQNINNLSSVIGNSNFDIGHVFSTGGGGVAYLGCVCTSSKAGGVTGSSNPIGDPFDIDYVAHEIGHQFGANHTFNSVTGSCSGNRNSSTAYEPGSGTTIMAYAGICGADNLQSNSDAYFHVISFDEIVAYTNSGSGNSCALITSTGNNAPIVTVPAGGFYIPKSTPFSLTGSATDPNGDAMTYSWEEFDLGPSGTPSTPSGDAPIFRSWNPSVSSIRYFPRLTDILNNSSVIGELLPSYARNLKFRLTVRDNRSAGGGVDWKQINFSVDGNSGPFLITSPNTNISWLGNTTQTVTWNVANTSSSPVNCANVKILLSTDGGNSFNTLLMNSTPNDGTEAVFIPNLPTALARIKVEAIGNIFFDISNVNFTIINNNSFQLSVSIDNGWNLISIPGLHPVNQNIDTWWQFRDLNANVFRFENGYQIVNTLLPGTGYWLKHSGFNLYNTGNEWPSGGIQIVPHTPIEALSGWNLFGGYEYEAITNGITTIPAGLQNGFVYGYSSVSGYFIAPNIIPGYAYWIKLNNIGQIVLPAPGYESILKDCSYLNEDFAKLTISDASGRTKTLYLVDDKTNISMFELPPLPGQDIFDIRFSSGGLAENISKDINEILIQGVNYPLQISCTNTSLIIHFADNKGSIHLNPGDVITINDLVENRLIVFAQELPDEFKLSQNYPNPFNPVTTIKFKVPSSNYLKLKLYNSIGEYLETITEGYYEAGSYSVSFNARKLSSGVYLYQLESEKTFLVKKLMIIK